MPNYVLEESSELAKEARLFIDGMKHGLNLKRSLSPRQYIVFYLKIVKNYPTSVIADIIGVTASTIRTHYQEALKKSHEIAQKT